MRNPSLSIASKLIAMALMSKSTPSFPLIQRLLAGVAAVLVLAMVASMLIGVLIVGGLYFGYQLLIQYGLEPQAALLSMGIFTAVLVIALFGSAVSYAKNMRGLAHHITIAESPVGSKATNVANAFMDGLKSSRAA